MTYRIWDCGLREGHCTTQARQEAHESLARAREEAEASVQAAELAALKAQDEAQVAHAAAQSSAASAEEWKRRCYRHPHVFVWLASVCPSFLRIAGCKDALRSGARLSSDLTGL